jgi:hypothetical protein
MKAMLRIKTISILFTILFLSPIFADAQEVGQIVAIKGQVLLKRIPAVKAALNDKILLDDFVETGELSRVKILFNDDSLLTLKEKTRVHIKEYMSVEGGKRGATIISLSDGFLKALRGSNDFEVHTPTAVAAARGTYFFVWTGIEGGIPVTWISVLEGKVEGSNINSQIAGSVMITSGMMSKVFQNQPPLSPAPISQDLINELLDCPKNDK